MNIELIKELREMTGAGVMDAKTALEEANGSVETAKDILRKKGIEKAEKRAERSADSGIVYAYIHGDGTSGAMVEINCETSFVAKTEDFKALAHEVALQVVSMDPENLEELLAQNYIRDGKQTIDGLVKDVIAKTGENIMIARFSRFAIGE